MPRIHVCTIMSGDSPPAGVRRAISKEREERGTGSVSGFSSAEWNIHSLSMDRHAVPHPRTHAREPAHKSRVTPTRLIFNPLDSVNACGRPPPHDVDSRPRFRVSGIRLLESCLRPRLSLAAGISHHRARFAGNVDYAPVSVFIPRERSKRPAYLVLGDAPHRTRLILLTQSSLALSRNCDACTFFHPLSIRSCNSSDLRNLKSDYLNDA